MIMKERVIIWAKKSQRKRKKKESVSRTYKKVHEVGMRKRKMTAKMVGEMRSGVCVRPDGRERWSATQRKISRG